MRSRASRLCLCQAKSPAGRRRAARISFNDAVPLRMHLLEVFFRGDSCRDAGACASAARPRRCNAFGSLRRSVVPGTRRRAARRLLRRQREHGTRSGRRVRLLCIALHVGAACPDSGPDHDVVLRDCSSSPPRRTSHGWPCGGTGPQTSQNALLKNRTPADAPGKTIADNPVGKQEHVS